MGPLTQNGEGPRRLSLLIFLSVTVVATYAQAQPASGRCVVTSVPNQVRAEGLTERMGDIFLQCSGSNPGAVLSGNLSIYLPVSITNRVDAANLTHDATLSVDYGSGFVPTGIAGLVTNQIIAFNGLNLTVPPSGNLNLQISGIRAAAHFAGTSPIQAQLTFGATTSFLVTQSLVVVASPQAGFYSTLYETGITCAASPQPSTFTLPNLFAAGTAFASTRVTEGFANAFLPRASGEDNGTRFLVKYSGFPANAHLYLPDAVAGSDAAAPTAGGDLGIPQQTGQYVPGSGTLLLLRVQGADATGAGGFLANLPLASGSGPIGLFSVSEVPLTNGAGYAVYEVADASPTAQETAQFPTFIAIPSVTGTTVAQESISLAPVSTVTAQSTTAPIQRFAAVTPASDCTLVGDCGAAYFPKLSVITTPTIPLTAVAGGDQTGKAGYIPIQNAGGGILNWTVTVSYLQGSGWLNLSSTSGQNAGSVFVTATAKNLTAGTYQANILVSAGLAGSITIPVTLTVSPAPPVTPTPSVVVTKVVNAATLDITPLVAGSLGTLFGSHLSGKNVSVTFDGNAAALLYTSDTQINLQVPLAVGTKTSSSMVVTVDGTSSTPTTVALAPAWPAVFAGGILNQDNTVNSAQTGAKAGTILQIFATGIPTAATVSVQIASRQGLIPLYAGDAPGVTGVQQVNVAIPDDLAAAPTQLTICASIAGQQHCSPTAPLTVW